MTQAPQLNRADKHFLPCLRNSPLPVSFFCLSIPFDASDMPSGLRPWFLAISHEWVPSSQLLLASFLLAGANSSIPPFSSACCFESSRCSVTTGAVSIYTGDVLCNFGVYHLLTGDLEAMPAWVKCICCVNPSSYASLSHHCAHITLAQKLRVEEKKEVNSKYQYSLKGFMVKSHELTN